MSLERKRNQRRKRRTLRVRAKFVSALPRLSIFRSLNHIYGQIIVELKNLSGSKSEKARAVGLELAKRALENGVAKAAFDRGRFLYHGRVKALADGLREAGMQL